jgi:nicotinamide mononucleotide adenylyltransferase
MHTTADFFTEQYIICMCHKKLRNIECKLRIISVEVESFQQELHDGRQHLDDLMLILKNIPCMS